MLSIKFVFLDFITLYFLAFLRIKRKIYTKIYLKYYFNNTFFFFYKYFGLHKKVPQNDTSRHRKDNEEKAGAFGDTSLGRFYSSSVNLTWQSHM